MADKHHSPTITTSSFQQTVVSGAPESNAGDRFHVLWACRRCLDLVAPNTTLRMVVVEGVAKEDGDPDSFLAADLTEYYSDKPNCTDFSSANQVVVSQLKYSTRKPTQPWTAARLCEKSGKAQPHSIISRLVDIYKEFRKGNHIDDVKHKLRLCLVSNQPVDSSLITALKNYGEISESSTGSDISRLSGASGLTGQEFTTFLSILDLSQCGQTSLVGQGLELFRKIGAMVFGGNNTDTAQLRIQELIMERSRPGGGNARPIRHEHIFSALGCLHEEDLFPAPTKFTVLDGVLETGAAARLTAQMQATCHRKILVHGSAGMGKTTVARQLQKALPPGSHVILYDCYGAGTYSQSLNERHSDDRALRQLANTLAMDLGVPFLIHSPERDPDKRREFQRRLVSASAEVKRQGDGWLVLLIDAADNSITAMEQNGEKNCFVFGLWELHLPDNVRLVVTCRTSRRKTLKFRNSDIELLELPEFSENDSAQMLRRIFPQATEQQCSRFHQFTHHTPRVQNNLLQLWRRKSPVDLDLLMKTPERGIELDDIFQEMWDAACLELGANSSRLNWLALLRTPIDPAILAQLCQVSPEILNNSLARLGTGLTQRNGGLSFQDEDFEDFIRRRISQEATSDNHAQLSGLLAPLASHSAYAALHLAYHYEEGRQWPELLNLAIDETWPSKSIISDPIQRHEAAAERVERALRVALKQDDKLVALKLLLLQGELYTAKNAISTVVIDHPDLAVLYGDPVLMERLFIRDLEWESLGTIHFQCAAILARYPSKRERALHHYRMGQVWLEEWCALPEDEHKSFPLQLPIFQAEAIFRLQDLENTFLYLSNNISPFEFSAQTAAILAVNLKGEVTDQQWSHLWREKHIHPLVAGMFITSAYWTGIRTDSVLATEVAQGIVDYVQNSDINIIQNILIDNYSHIRTRQIYWVDLCEALAASGTDANLVITLLNKFPMPHPSEHLRTIGWDRFLRSVILREYLSGETWQSTAYLPPHLTAVKLDYNNETWRKKYEKILVRFLPVMRLRVRCLMETPTMKDVVPLLQKAINKDQRRYEYGWEAEEQFRQMLFWAVEAILYCPGDGREIISELVNSLNNLFMQTAFVLELASHLVKYNTYRDLGLDWVEQAANKALLEHTSAPEKTEYLLQCIAIAQPYDVDLGRQFFNLAIESTQGPDEDAVFLLLGLLETAHPLSGKISMEDARRLSQEFLRSAFAFHGINLEQTSFVLEKAIEVITKLHLPTGVQVIIAWDAHNVIPLNRSVPILLTILFEENDFSLESTFALIRLVEESRFPTQLVCDLLTRMADRWGKEKNTLEKLFPHLSLWIRKDVPLNDRVDVATKVLSILDRKNLPNLPGVTELKAMLDIIKKLDRARDIPHDPIPDLHHDEKKENDVLEALLSNLPTPHWKHLEQVREAMGTEYYQFWPEFMSTLHRQIGRKDRIDYLNCLVTALPGSDTNTVLDALLNSITSWESDSRVKERLPNGIERFLEHALLNLIELDYARQDKLTLLFDKTNLRPEKYWSLLLGKNGNNLRSASAKDFYCILKILSNALQVNQRNELVSWAIGRLGNTVNKTVSSFPSISEWRNELSGDVLPLLFHTLLGHPDKRIRWRAMHAARLIVRDFDSALLGQILALDENNAIHPFATPESPFLWMSARLFLVLLCDRLAHEAPQVVHPNMKWLLARAMDSEFPHALVRYHAARTVLMLEQAYPNILPRSKYNELKWLVHLNRVSHANSSNNIDEIELFDSNRIDFDRYDTIPYWFRPFGSVFGLSIANIAKQVEYWICDRWGTSKNDLEYVRQTVYNHYDYNMITNRHGTFPTVESFRLSMIYHAINCVVGVLIDEQRSNDITFSNASPNNKNSWNDWDNWFMFPYHSYPFWISELLDPTPHDLPCWQWSSVGVWGAVLDKTFETALGLDSTECDDEWLIIFGNEEFSSDGKLVRIDIDSALVNPDKAIVALEAWQNAKHPFDDILPSEGLYICDHDYDAASSLINWLKYSTVGSNLDDKDPFLKGKDRKIIISPGHLLREYFGLTGDIYGKTFCSNGDHHTIWRYEKWNDANPEKQDSYIFYSSGDRIHFRLHALFDFLDAVNKVLILSVQVDRKNLRAGKKDLDINNTTPVWRVYLLHANGTLQWQQGSRQLAPRVASSCQS